MASRIVLSFANYGGGTVFITTFQQNLMKKLNWYNPTTIYCDNIACRQVEGSKYWGPDKRIGGEGYAANVSPWFHGKAMGDQGGGAACIGVTNARWKEMWDAAVKSAKAIIMVLTEPYIESGPCKMEVQTISQILQDRTDLHLIVLDMGGDLARQLPKNLWGHRRVRVLKFGKVAHSMSSIFPDAFDLPPEGYDVLIDALSATGATQPGSGL